MADLIAYQSGNWTGATTWKGVATSTGAKQASFASTTTVGTTYSYSPTFTITNGVVIEGVLLYGLRGVNTGTVSIALSDDNGTTATREVTVDSADLPFNPSWIFFKFGTSLTGDGGTDYRIGVKGSSSNTAGFGRSATTADWARYLRTNSTATAAATDVTFICDELTGQGAKTDIEVTMNSTANTSYGECNIGAGGVLSYGTSASTNYHLRLAGNLNIWGDGTLNIGTSGTRIPSTSTALLEFNNSTNVDFGLEVRFGGTCNLFGATKTTTNTLLTADAASGQKVVTVASTSGWASGDVIFLASTTRTSSQSEKRIIDTVDSATQVTVTVNLTNTHHGVSPYQGEVINVTRNVRVRGTSQTLCAYVNAAQQSNFTAEYVEFSFLGGGSSPKRGIGSGHTTGSTFSLKFSSTYDLNATAYIFEATGGGSSAYILEDNSFSRTEITGTILQTAATSGTPSFQRNYVIGTGGILNFGDIGATIKDNRFAGTAITLDEDGATFGTIQDNVVHSASTGVTLGGSNAQFGTFGSMAVWRCNINVSLAGSGFIIDSLDSRHAGTSNLMLASTGNAVKCLVTNSTFDGGSGASLSASPNHFRNSAGVACDIIFDNCSFGATVQATSAAVNVASANILNAVFRRCTIAESNIVLTSNNLRNGVFGESFIGFDKFNNTSGSHRAYKRYGRTESDQSTFNTAAPSEALLPNDASGKLPSGSKKFAVASGTTATVNVYVRKSATYNGNQPRLIVKANSIAGITTDTVLDTMTVGTGTWEQLSGTTATVSDDCVLEVYVDCDGTAGTVNVDDWSVS